MVNFFIRDFKEKDLYEVSDLYIEAFSERPWNEFKKCKRCGINYGKNEVKKVEYYTGFRGQKDSYMTVVNKKGKIISKCKKCRCSVKPEGEGGCKPVYRTSTNLVDFWTRKDVENDLRFCQSQANPKILVTERIPRFISGVWEDVTYSILGFCWGYRLPFEKFPFLFQKVEKNSGYVDEIVVRSDFRRMSIGKNMLQGVLNSFDENQMRQAVVRTLTTSNAYPLFRKLDFKDIGRIDKNDMYENRVYLVKNL
jgi:ribosomal protein S18 acetylase RimI-like enzyme